MSHARIPEYAVVVIGAAGNLAKNEGPPHIEFQAFPSPVPPQEERTMKKFNPQKILVAVDFSTLSREALRAGLNFGKLRGAEVTALHVARGKGHKTLFTAEGEGLVPDITASKNLEDACIALENRLELMIRAVSAGEKAASVVLHGNPKKEILGFARSGGFDLIVMGTHGREGLSRVFLGSVAEHVLRHAPCPVFVVRDKAAKERAAWMTMEKALLN